MKYLVTLKVSEYNSKAKADELRVLFLNLIGILPPVLTRLILSYIDPIEEYLESSWNEMRENLKKIKGVYAEEFERHYG